MYTTCIEGSHMFKYDVIQLYTYIPLLEGGLSRLVSVAYSPYNRTESYGNIAHEPS